MKELNLRTDKKINATTGANYLRYLSDIGYSSIQYLTKEDEIRLFKQLSTPESIDARDEIVRGTQPLIIATAGKYVSASNTLEELICIGNVGLLECLNKFDINKGVRFTYFAIYHVRGKILDSFKKDRNYISLDSPTDNDINLHEVIPSQMIPLTPNAELIHLELNRALKSLTDIERTIISMIYGIGEYDRVTNQTAANVLNLPYKRYEQIRNTAMNKLKRLTSLKELLELL